MLILFCPNLGHASVFAPSPAPDLPQVALDFDAVWCPHAGGRGWLGTRGSLSSSSSSSSRRAAPAAGGFHDVGEGWRNRR